MSETDLILRMNFPIQLVLRIEHNLGMSVTHLGRVVILSTKKYHSRYSNSPSTPEDPLWSSGYGKYSSRAILL